MNKSIHIFIPAYNEEKSIRQVILKIRENGFQNIYIVDDGSEDRTSFIAKSEGAIVIRHIINRGVGAATQTAISYAKKHQFNYMILMDADGQHDPADIEKMVLKMKTSNTDMVIGSRFLNDYKSIPFSRKLYNSIGNKLINLSCKNNYSDTQSGFKLLNKHAIHSFNLQIDNFAFCSEMILLAERKELKVIEIPIQAIYTKYSLGKGQGLTEGIKTIFSFWWKLIYGN